MREFLRKAGKTIFNYLDGLHSDHDLPLERPRSDAILPVVVHQAGYSQPISVF